MMTIQKDPTEKSEGEGGVTTLTKTSRYNTQTLLARHSGRYITNCLKNITFGINQSSMQILRPFFVSHKMFIHDWPRIIPH